MNVCLCVRLFSSQPGRCLWTNFYGDSNATDGESEEEVGEDVNNDEVGIGRSVGARSRFSSSRNYTSTIPATVLSLGTVRTTVSRVWPTLFQVQYFGMRGLRQVGFVLNGVCRTCHGKQCQHTHAVKRHLLATDVDTESGVYQMCCRVCTCICSCIQHVFSNSARQSGAMTVTSYFLIYSSPAPHSLSCAVPHSIPGFCRFWCRRNISSSVCCRKGCLLARLQASAQRQQIRVNVQGNVEQLAGPASHNLCLI